MLLLCSKTVPSQMFPSSILVVCSVALLCSRQPGLSVIAHIFLVKTKQNKTQHMKIFAIFLTVVIIGALALNMMVFSKKTQLQEVALATKSPTEFAIMIDGVLLGEWVPIEKLEKGLALVENFKTEGYRDVSIEVR